MPIEDFVISVCCCVAGYWEVLSEGKRLRQRIETVIGQLREHFGIERVWTKDL